jgi:two-component system heavy metal sensor histidine kinase CusS
MSSTRAEEAGRGAPGAGGWSRLSITVRLALLYALSTFVLLAASTAVLQWAFTTNLELDDLYYLRSKIRILRMAARDLPQGATILRHEVVAEGGSYDSHQFAVFYSRLLDEQGNVVVETPGMSRMVPDGSFPPPEDAGKNPEVMRAWESPHGRSYWLMAARAESGGRPAVIQVALDDTEEVTLLRDYQRISMAVLLIGTLLAAAVGVLVARHSLRPLRRIARAAERITASHLTERVDPQRWPAELADLARSFDLMLGRLDDSFRRLSQFSADLAHELRTPIHNLTGETEVALSRERQPDEYRELLQSNLEELERLTRMINGLLFLARAENPATHIERVRLDARRELDAVREFHEALAEETGVSMSCDGQGLVDADPVLFRRAVTNLVSNALRHTPKGGEVNLAVRREEDGSVLVAVRDTGCGIPEEHLPRIFDRFYRTERPGLHNPDGTGLGLAIVKSIMELHGGTVTVQSDAATGSAFILRFPPPGDAVPPRA